MVGNRVVLTALCASLAACGNAEQSDSSVKELTVASYKRPCTGEGDYLCLLVKAEAGDAWQNHYGGIAGFTFAWGREQRLLVRETEVPNPPADGGSSELSLLAVMHVKEDANGSEYLLGNIALGAGVVSHDGAGIYRLYGEPFACAPTAGCASLLAQSGSNRRVDMRFAYTSTAVPPITLVAWAYSL